MYNEVEIRTSPFTTAQITFRDLRNQSSGEPIREVKIKRSLKLSSDNSFYKCKVKSEIMKEKCMEGLYRAYYSSNTHPSVEELYKYSFTDELHEINTKITKFK